MVDICYKGAMLPLYGVLPWEQYKLLATKYFSLLSPYSSDPCDEDDDDDADDDVDDDDGDEHGDDSAAMTWNAFELYSFCLINWKIATHLV